MEKLETSARSLVIELALAFYEGCCSSYYLSSGSSSLYCLCGCLCLNSLMASVIDSASIIMIIYCESRLDQYSNSYGFTFYPLAYYSLLIKLRFMIVDILRALVEIQRKILSLLYMAVTAESATTAMTCTALSQGYSLGGSFCGLLGARASSGTGKRQLRGRN